LIETAGTIHAPHSASLVVDEHREASAGITAGRFQETGDNMRASSVSFQAAVLIVLAGMAWGLQMAMTQDHAAYPAHAHLNLLGWVSLFLFGIFYHLHPELDRSRAALVQVGSWIVGTVVMTVGVGLVHTGHSAAEPLAAVGSLIVFAAMLLFGWLVLQRDRGSARAGAVVPAE
jgi:FtsH-binding integral membrane protein